VLNGTQNPKPVSISVVESPKVPRIGVGEATVPTIVNTLQQLRIPESEFLRAADATFKQGIRFDGCRQETNHFYYHCFDLYQVRGRDFHGLGLAASDGKLPFAYYVSAQPALCDSIQGAAKTLRRRIHRSIQLRLSHGC